MGAGGTQCWQCPAGSFQDRPGQTSCQACPTGSKQSSTGSTSCDACPVGLTQNEVCRQLTTQCGSYSENQGSITCSQCPTSAPLSDSGTSTRSQCFALPPGSIVDSNKCSFRCPAGTFSQAVTKTCATCPDGSISSSGSSTCQPCGTGTAPDATKATCTPTSTRQITKRRKIPTCPAGYKACPVGRGKNLECVDVSSHLTSCGACPGSDEGTDCTLFDSMASASCVMGKCQYECPMGYAMGEEGCERVKGQRRR